MRFKIGQKIRVVSSEAGADPPVGSEHEVAHIFNGGVGVLWNDSPGWPLFADQVEPATPDAFAAIHNADDGQVGANMRGEYGESIVRMTYIQNGWRVSSSPANYPYDLVIERHGITRRVQVKTVWRSSVVNFKTTDDFDTAVIVSGNGSIYAIPRGEMRFTSAGADSSRSKFKLTKALKSRFKIGTFSPIAFEDHVIVA